MSEAKHTPGPWHWVNSQTDEPFDFDAEWDGDGYPSLRTVAEFGENKTDVIDGKSYTSWALPKWICDAEPMQHGNDAANARLIAAAPELFDALIDVLTWMDAPDQSAFSDSQLAKARAAIAKATGSSEVTE